MLDYEDRIAYDLALFVPGMMTIALRYWVRYRASRLRQLSWVLSDVFVGVALIMAAAVIGLDIWFMTQQINLRQYPKEDILGQVQEGLKVSVAFRKVALFNQYAYICALWAVKAAFLCSYYTMSAHISLRLRRAINLTWITLALTWAGLTLAFTFWCQPINRNWSLGSDFCSPQAFESQAILVYALHIGTDIPVMVIPFFIIHTLQLGRMERYAVAFMFVLGFMTAVCSTFSFALHMQFVQLGHDSDATELSIQEKLDGIYLSAVAEVWGSVFVVCLPSIRLAVRWLCNVRDKEKSSRGVSEEELELTPTKGITVKTEVLTTSTSELPSYVHRKQISQISFGRDEGVAPSYHARVYDGSFDFDRYYPEKKNITRPR